MANTAAQFTSASVTFGNISAGVFTSGGTSLDGSVTGQVTNNGNFIITGTLQINGSSTHTGSSLFNGAVTMTQPLGGTSGIFSGSVQAATLTSTGNTSVQGALGVTGLTTLNAGANITGNVNITGSLAVNTSNATGGGLVLSDDGDFVDNNDTYGSFRFTGGIKIMNGMKASGTGAAVVLGSNGHVSATQFNGSGAGLTGTAASLTAGAVAWGSITGKPNVSALGFQWNWNGQGGQPTWLWGGNDGGTMYVYNPGNFSVNYATSAGSAGSASVSSTVVINYNNGSNSNYQMLWGSGNGVYGNSNIYCNPATGALVASKVYNAVWNDIADFLELDEPLSEEIRFGHVYIRDDGDSVRVANKYASPGIIGIASDTYGFGVGKKDDDVPQLPVAIGGFVLAKLDRTYPAGTALTSAQNGGLTKARWYTRVFNPERIVATFYKAEKHPEWNGIAVGGRHWVKIK